MSDPWGHSWVGLNPRTCRYCGATEGNTNAVYRPCPKRPSAPPNRRNPMPADLQREKKRKKILAAASRKARQEAEKTMRSMVCGGGRHKECKATHDHCLCECHD